jgi:ABC-type uncharacterized transport system YnjBCD substrate-binding protein
VAELSAPNWTSQNVQLSQSGFGATDGYFANWALHHPNRLKIVHDFIIQGF